MKPAIFMTAVWLTLTSPTDAQRRNPKESFSEWDRNKDGKLVRNELPQQLQRNFDRVDSNDDGFISLEEHLAVLSRGQNRQNSPRVPDAVELVADIPYANTKNSRQTLHLLLPKRRAAETRLPVVVFIHGGGWRNGDKSRGTAFVQRFVESGSYAGITVGYRLSGEAIWPAQIHDCKAAIRWIRGNAKKYGLDANRIGVTGTSAGGHLVAMLGVSSDVPAIEGKLGKHLDQSSSVTCVINQYGPSELLRMNDFPSRIDHDAADSPESQLIGGAIQENKQLANAASPTSYVSKDDAPMLMIHGDKDPLVPIDQSERLLKKLREAGVDAGLIRIKDGQHGGFRSREVDLRINNYFTQHLLGKSVDVSLDPIQAGARQR